MKLTTILILSLISFFLIEAGAQVTTPVDTPETRRKPKGPELFKKAKTKIANPLDLRDPFKRKYKRTRSRAKGRNKKLRDGFFSNAQTIDDQPLDSIRIVGILIGKERRAIAKLAQGDSLSKESYILKEGMTLGENNAEIKAILPGGVVLVEKIRNVYDQDEYLETVLPVISRF
jgi:Tfp pilus assembly protein PilP